MWLSETNSSESPSTRRRGLTLVEMLIGMAITLVMMAAVVNLFANLSAGVRNRQGKMELNATVRMARAQLHRDLEGATCLELPKQGLPVDLRPDMNNPPDGYFEYVEGDHSDNERTSLALDPAVSTIPSSNLPLSAGEVTDFGGLGDYDDILAMTVRSDVAPFHGRGRGLRPGGVATVAADWIDLPIESPLAEVVWFAVENPADGSEGEPGMRRVYRRTLLIAPWLGTATDVNGNTRTDWALDLVGRGITNYSGQLAALREFQALYDISVRLENGRIVPNTLADLARRENRFAHLPHNTVADPDDYKYPHPFPYDVNSLSPDPYNSPEAGLANSSLHPLEDERAGEDLMLTDVLAFDVQTFDPAAPLYEYQGTMVHPTAGVAFTAAVNSGPTNIKGFGSYVDLGWNNAGQYDYTTISGAPPTLFQQERVVGWFPGAAPNAFRGRSGPHDYFVYDTWTTYYETDQIDQDDDRLIDQGTNGLDDPARYDDDRDQDTPAVFDTRNGPDDLGEMETSPPYPYPLQGIQVKLRVYEPATRQIRETTVTRKLGL